MNCGVKLHLSLLAQYTMLTEFHLAGLNTFQQALLSQHLQGLTRVSKSYVPQFDSILI